MMIRVRHLILLAAGVAVAAVGVLWLGLVQISASSGHWAITDWALHAVMRQSVRFHAAGVEVPDLSDPAMVRRGAGHFESGCAACHGSPARPRGPVVMSMTPYPPDLATRIDDWRPQDLFWIVKHGVKFTGMPAWPTQARDDEVWSMVAFLRALPGMDAATYHRQAFGPRENEGDAADLSTAVRPARADCVRCHGDDGLGDPNGAFPRLDIQPEPVLIAALQAYANGTRASGIMQASASGLSDAELRRLAASYARDAPLQGAALATSEVVPTVLARGEEIAKLGIPRHDVAACDGCHGAEAVARQPDFPRIAGQYPAYLEDQLALFADEEAARGGGRYATLMTLAAHRLDPADIKAVAQWYASRAPHGLEGGPSREAAPAGN